MPTPDNTTNAVTLLPWYMSATTRAAIATGIVFFLNTAKISADPAFVNTAVNWALDGGVVIGGIWTLIAHWRAKRQIQAAANVAVAQAVQQTTALLKGS